MGRPIRGGPSAGWVASTPLRALAICRAPRISASRASCVERSGPVTGLRAGDKHWRRPPSQMPAAVTDQALGAGRGWTIRPRLRRSLRSTGIRPEEQGKAASASTAVVDYVMRPSQSGRSSYTSARIYEMFLACSDGRRQSRLQNWTWI